ncbi:hypothetical protein [Rhodobacter sp. NTK016B]|uniref:hypothetical protein n=1 Tax=Rhodobacter sp. NTK016B TaxID=2759676 RepID=UPI0032E39CD0
MPKGTWMDTEGVVNRQRRVTQAELRDRRFKPETLPETVFGHGGIGYDPLKLLAP